MKLRPIVFLDTETTGLSARDGRVVEIGALRVEDGRVVAELRQLLDPGQPLPGFITQLTGINDEQLRGAPSFPEIMPKLDELLDGAIMAAHNISFDHSFLSEEYRRAGDRLSVDRFCTAQLSRRLYPQHRRHSLDALIARGNYQVVDRHRAYDDAEVLWRFFQDAVAEHGDRVYEVVAKILRKTRYRPAEGPRSCELL